MPFIVQIGISLGHLLILTVISFLLIGLDAIFQDIIFFAPVYFLFILQSLAIFLKTQKATLLPRNLDLWVLVSFYFMTSLQLLLAAFLFIKMPPLWLAPLWFKKIGLFIALAWAISENSIALWTQTIEKQLAANQYIVLDNGRTVPIFWGLGIQRFIRYPEFASQILLPLGMIIYFNTIWPLLLWPLHIAAIILWLQYLDKTLEKKLNQHLSGKMEKIKKIIPYYY